MGPFAQCNKKFNFFFLQTNGLQLIKSSKKKKIHYATVKDCICQ